MQNIRFVIIALLVALLSACGSINVEIRPPSGESGTTSTAVSQIEVPTIEANAPTVNTPAVNAPTVNDPTVAAQDVTAPAVSTIEANTPTTTTPEAARPTTTEGDAPQDADTVFASLLEEHGADYAECGFDITAAEACAKPESLGDTDLKQNINIQLILDSSGSMAEQIGGETKLDIAKRTLNQFVGTLPKNANVGLRVYGHTGSNQEQDKALSCQGTELFYPFAPLDAAQFTSAIDSFEPRGWTPIATSLQAAQQDFAAFDGATNTNIIYLVSDGIETCDGDPVAAAKALRESNIQAIVNVIGFNVDAAAAQQLRAAAEAGGGAYFDARNAAELESVFKDNFDWVAWSAYYLCILARGTRADLSNITNVNEFSLCVTTRAASEYVGLVGAINGNRDYQDIRSELIERADERRKKVLADAEQLRQDGLGQVDQQQQDREQLLVTPSPSP
jgi:Ca-activated chloride channel family protein